MSATPDPAADRLGAYRAKRSVGVTPEPAGAVAASAGSLFVVHKHAARQLHFDLRLGMEGVLRSWAVPKGPSRDPAEKRLAVLVEDHPVEYGDFEGVIPEGNYGAGATIVWDRGAWIPLEEPLEGLERGKLLFDLHGYKLRGRWTLVRIKKSERDWLLIKERDQHADADAPPFSEASVLSGLTVEELRDGIDRGAALADELRRLGAPAGAVDPGSVEVMLAERREEPFSDPAWVFEIKYDGYRLVASKVGGAAALRTRNGHDATATFPEIAKAVGALPVDDVVLDGEVVVHDPDGRPSFQRLQRRGRLHGQGEIRRAVVEHPATLYVFDLLGLADLDVRSLRLADRKRVLQRLLPPLGALRYVDHVEAEGEAFFRAAVDMGLEGMVGKRVDAPYRRGRSADWRKVRADLADDFVVVGYTEPQAHREGFGALHLATWEGGEFRYAGRVGSGFSAGELAEIRRRLDAVRRDAPPCTGVAAAGHVWAEPVLVCAVRYREWTDDGVLRHPTFLGLRDDKAPQECVTPHRADPELAAVDATPPSREVPLSNRTKVFWPREGYTKGDLLAYYESMAPWLLPYLRDRPLVLTRYPDGIEGKSFFQKDAPAFAPEWIRTERMWSDHSRRELSYFVCDDEASLLYVANMGSIPLHVWSSRVASLEHPDWSILDLDPKGAPFDDVIRVARALRHLCEEIALPSYVKTSGSSGLHVLVPLARQCTHDQARTLAELLARVVVAEQPGLATLTRVIEGREGKVYLDYLQNGHGKLLVAPFSVRPLPGAPVSMPLPWDEVRAGLRILDYTIATARERMASASQDPMAALLHERPDFAAVLGRLTERIALTERDGPGR